MAAEEQKIIDEYLNRIKVQLVNLKFSFFADALQSRDDGRAGGPQGLCAGLLPLCRRSDGAYVG